MTTYVYHYCASYRDGSTETRIDGVYHTNCMVLGMEDYGNLKRWISFENASKLTVYSLSLLHVLEE